MINTDSYANAILETYHSGKVGYNWKEEIRDDLKFKHFSGKFYSAKDRKNFFMVSMTLETDNVYDLFKEMDFDFCNLIMPPLITIRVNGKIQNTIYHNCVLEYMPDMTKITYSKCVLS